MTATASSVETSPGQNGSAAATRRTHANGNGNGVQTESATASTARRTTKSPQKKYRHVAAVHSQTRPSCLSHDSDAAPSFLGFRNLMVIVLGK